MRFDDAELPPLENDVPGPAIAGCPWCGFPLPADGKRCANCRWTKRGTSPATQLWAYIAFFVVMIVAFTVAIIVIKQVTHTT